MPDAAIKYQPYPQVGLRDRTWPNAVIDKPPVWIAGLVVLFGAAYANLLRITEFLYYQF